MNRFLMAPIALVCVALAGVSTAQSRNADTVLFNGKILSVDDRFSEYDAIAIRDGKIARLGTTSEIRKLADSSTVTIDLQGRTVIPGLIDSHIHGIRAGLSFATEVNWIGAPSLTEAIARIRDGAKARPRGAWLIVAGGWNVQQFKERRRPTQAELEAATPDNPVYVQLGYGWAMLSPLALKALNIQHESDLPARARLERDADGRLSGAIIGPQDAIVALFDRLPKPSFEQQVEGTRLFFRELNRLGITGIVDAGGNNLTHEDYQALFRLWREQQMTVRVAYGLCPLTPGAELEDFKGWTRLLPMGFGDSMLHFNGLGERVTLAMNNNDNPTEAEKDRYFEVARWAAQNSLSLTMHWQRDASVHHLLDVFERVNKEIPVAALRWSIAHLNDASPETLRRMKALGVGWTVQDALYFGGEALQQQAGRPEVLRQPPVVTARGLGIFIGAGTDAHRVASYNPFTALQWFQDGKTVGSVTLRGPEETPSRAEALRFYTKGSAWFSKDEATRGSLEVGKLADLAVLSKDYMTVPAESIGGIESLLTMVAGHIVYASGPYAKHEARR